MFLFVVKMVHPDTRAGFSDINIKLDNRNMSQFKHYISKENIQIAEWMNRIPISRESYSEMFIK